MNEIAINLSANCSLACSYCTLGQFSSQGHGDMEPWLRAALQKYILSDRELITVTLGFLGETTIIPWFPEWVTPLLDAGKKLNIVSNAARPFTPEVLKVLARFNDIMFSIDSSNAEVLKKLRGVDLKVFLENTKKIKETGCQNVSWTAVWVAGSAKEFQSLVLLALCHGIKKININLIFKFKEAVNSPDSPISLQGEEFLTELSTLDSACYYARINCVEMGIPFQGTIDVLKNQAETGRPNNSLELVEAKNIQGTAQFYTAPLFAGETRCCNSPWSGPYVAANGDVYPCCFNGIVIDTITPVKTLEQIWNGSRYAGLKNALITGKNLNDTCFKCKNPKKRV
jgi:MoaA/NifB/PqqE/SkfB family radical SAM enzyme